MGRWLFILLFLAGCSNPGVVQLSPDTYILYGVDKGGIFGNSARLKANVIREANAFAASMGKVAVPISSAETPMFPGHFATFEYQFRVISSEDPEYKRSGQFIDRGSKSSLGVTVKSERNDSENVYSELIKLEDLRQRKIITEVEFEAQKKKLLKDN